MGEIEIPDGVYETLSERAEEKGFETTEDYIIDILEQVCRKLEKKKGGKGDKNKESFSKEEEEKVKERLRGLGYLD